MRWGNLDAYGTPSLSSDSPWAPPRWRGGSGTLGAVVPEGWMGAEPGLGICRGEDAALGSAHRQGGPHAGAECLTPVG